MGSGSSLCSFATNKTNSNEISNSNNDIYIQKLSKDEKDLSLAAVIVTISRGSSYDQLFHQQKQEAPEGCRVSVWNFALTLNNILALKNALTDPSQTKTALKSLLTEIQEVEPASVLFNFECCSSVSEGIGFGSSELDKATIKAISIMLNKGHYVMMSDFSLKALLSRWDKDLLGMNPFVQIGVTNKNCHLRFNPNTLKECDSPQLVSLGQLSENGESIVNAMGGTIVFARNTDAISTTEPYTLEILTVAVQLDSLPVNKHIYLDSPKLFEFSKIKEHEGPIGQAILSYKSGGRLILSSCHWISLTHINTSESNVFKAYELNNGADYARQKRAEYDNLPVNEQIHKLQEYANCIVQSSAPCKYSKKF